MKHEAKQINLKDMGDGAISVLMRCCGDASTESWHTLYVNVDTTEQEIEDFLDGAKLHCERMHAARDKARAIISKGM